MDDNEIAESIMWEDLHKFHRLYGDRWAIVPIEPTLEQQKAGYDALKALYPEEYKKENPVGHYRVYEAMVEEGRVQ